MAFRRRPTTPLGHLTENQIADRLDLMAGAGGLDRELVDEACRRLRRGGGVHISDTVAGGDIIATSHRYER